MWSRDEAIVAHYGGLNRQQGAKKSQRAERVDVNCSEDQFIAKIVEVNRGAGVEGELIDLIAAYARLCLRFGKSPVFYEENPGFETKRPMIRKLIEENLHLDPRGLSFLASYAEMMRRKRLPFFFDIRHLARYFGMSRDELNRLIREKELHYREFSIPKHGGGSRVIFAPTETLKGIQRHILAGVLERVPVHSCANGFRRRRSIVTNAENHVGREVVLKIDIKDFFPSISSARVRAAYVGLGFPEGVADVMSELSTFRGRLPMGAPTSPYLSNIIASKLDRRISRLAKRLDFTYSRYADDLAFSSRDVDFPRKIPLFRRIIEDEGFRINEKKLVISRKGGRQKLTGVVVNRKLNVQKDEYRRLRAVVHNCRFGNLDEQIKRWGASDLAGFKSSLCGRISFLRMVNVEKGEKLFEAFRKVQWPV